MKRKMVGLLLIAAALLAPPAGAQPLPPPLSSAQGHGATVTPVGPHAILIRFLPGEWPNAGWTAPNGKPWDWHGNATIAFKASNTGKQPIDFNLRVDDDPKADGIHHTRSGSASLGPGQSGEFFLDLAPFDSRTTMGMVGSPPHPNRAGMEDMKGGGGVDPSHIYAFQIFTHLPAAPESLRVSDLRLLPSLPSADLYRGIVDRFGQFTRADWPGKAHSLADIKAQRDQESRELAAEPSLPGRDQYGGWAAGPQLPATGFFHTTKYKDKWWLVTPSGHLFLSFGIDVVDMSEATIVHPRDAMFTWLPGADDPLARFYSTKYYYIYGPNKTGKTFDFYGANLMRKYGPDYPAAWRRVTVDRLKSWGFNTIGNWSNESLEAMDEVPYTARMDIPGSHARVSSGSDYWGKMHDPFDPQFAVDADAYFRAKAPALKNDPWIVGYFVDNELSWSGGSVDGGRYGLAYGTLAAPADQPAKKAFLAQLQAKYGDIGKLNAAWGTNLAGWDTLEAPYQASETPNDAQKADMGAFVYAFAKKYFTVVRDTLKKYDPNHLYLGCRFAGYTPEAVRAASEICDVISFNIYRPRLDPKAWAFTQDLNKPCIIGEFHFGALDRGMFHPGLVSTPNQQARAAMFKDYIDSVADNPAFVGAHWFQYVDEPLTGRALDGENYNIGFVSVTDHPYPEMVQAARQVFAGVYARRAR